jgi:thioredoxin:protein disulfide reductase
MEKKLILCLSSALLLTGFAASLALAQASARVVKPRGLISADAIRPGDKFKVAVVLDIEQGYHINSHNPTAHNSNLDYLIPTVVGFEPAPGIRFGEIKYPSAQYKKFDFSPTDELAVHEGTVIITAEAEAESSIKQGAQVIRAKVTVQSCNDSVCLAPSDLQVEIPVKVIAAGQAVNEVNKETFELAAQLVQFQGRGKKNDIAELIATRGLPVALVVIFLSGLALNLTPCVYPIIPITIGFFVNQGAAEGAPRLRRTFAMASMYTLGLALTYSILGVVASLTGGLFGGALQNPLVLIGIAALMIALSLSMFGVYEFKMPESLNRFATKSTQSTSGMIGALVMGLTMGIVAAPCIGPVVLALLVFVGEKGDPVLGFFIFFVLALGLGLPYLLLGTFSGSLKALPRSGMWMITVRKVFGLVLIGLAIYFLMPLLGRFTNIVLIVFLAVSALYLLFWEAGKTKPKQFAWLLRALGAGAAVVAVLLALPAKARESVTWQPYSEQAVAAARSEGKAVIVDVFADWCIPCKELDQLTFTDSDVRREASGFVTLKLDLTSSDPQSEAARARQRFNILGVPTIIFIDGQGRERSELRLEGFEKPDSFLARMRKVGGATSSGQTVLAANTKDTAAPLSDAVAGSPEPVPALDLDLLDGKKLATGSLGGKVVLIDFWATWCVPCISEIPMFNQLNKEYKDRGLELIAISLDVEGAQKVKPFLKKYPMSYTQALGDTVLAGKFNVDDSSLPVALVIDKQGRVRFRHIGITKREVFEAEIKQLLGE